MAIFVYSEHISFQVYVKMHHKVRTQFTVWTETSVFKSQHSGTSTLRIRLLLNTNPSFKHMGYKF